MKLSRILFKPGWQDKDAATRLATVAGDDDAELITALPELARGDADARVRLAALRRLGDYECWRERSTADPDPELRHTARSAYITMLCAGAPGSPELPRLIAELDTLSGAEIETVATAATQRDLRAAALARVSRTALLAERAGADPDPELRLAALRRIDDDAVLERIVERTRKADKTINRAARERLQTLRIEGGDARAIAARARALCERVEALVRAPAPDCDTQRAAIEADWKLLGTAVPTDLATRFNGAAALLRAPARVDEPRPAPAPAPEDATAPGQAAGDRSDGDPRAGSPVEVVSRARFDAAVSVAAEHARRESKGRDAALRRCEELLTRLAAALDAGDTGAAQAEDAEIGKCLKALKPPPRTLEQRLAPLHARLAELKRWQHWASQRRRRTLCAEIEALPSSGLHPDALATRVHEARAEWSRLDAMEGHDHAGETSGIARRFFAACQRALKPAQAYFARRDSVRNAHREELDTLLARQAALPADSEDWKALAKLRQQLAAGLRSLGTLNPRDRHAYARRLKEAIAVLSPRLEVHERQIQSEKAQLIEQAQGLAGNADRNGARAARELQQRWTALGAGRRSTDQKQWREFRKACDQVFTTLDGERRQREANDAERLARTRALVAEAEAPLDDEAQDAAGVTARRNDLAARWRENGPADRALERRFRLALDALSARVDELARKHRLARFTDALDAYACVRALESGRETAQSDLDRVEPAGDFAVLHDRRRRALESKSADADADTIAAARDVLIRVEFLGGMPTPEEDAARRMSYQVSRLSAHLRGGSRAAPEQELAALLAEWFALPGSVPDALDERFLRAARAALATLP